MAAVRVGTGQKPGVMVNMASRAEEHLAAAAEIAAEPAEDAAGVGVALVTVATVHAQSW